MGIPAAGKSTAAAFLANYLSIPHIHGSRVVMEACPGDWIARGDMAPEPDATIAIETEVQKHNDWVLDGFPRSIWQLRSPIVRREAIVFLDVSPAQALRRAVARGRNSELIEAKRIREQSNLLAPIRALSAVIIPTTFRTTDQVNQLILDWLMYDIHPNALGSAAR